MLESRDHAEPSRADGHIFFDTEVPEPVEHWALEDFTDIVPAELR